MPKPVPPLKWIENSPTSILFRADAPRVWHSGRAVDVLPVDDDLVLIGTEAGVSGSPTARATPGRSATAGTIPTSSA
jgi:hypothetical protein